jgi:hypothetical protein
MTSDQHEALMKKMSISEKEDKEWHKTHRMSLKTSKKLERKPINPFAVGGGFLHYCVKQRWLIQEGKGRNAKYCVTQEGQKEIRKFGIKI